MLAVRLEKTSLFQFYSLNTESTTQETMKYDMMFLLNVSKFQSYLMVPIQYVPIHRYESRHACMQPIHYTGITQNYTYIHKHMSYWERFGPIMPDDWQLYSFMGEVGEASSLYIYKAKDSYVGGWESWWKRSECETVWGQWATKGVGEYVKWNNAKKGT